MDGKEDHPVAIGGIGGSGTRVGAALLQMLGFYIGDDLNKSLDNLWFTLLFKRRAILSQTDNEFRTLYSLFKSRMSGRADFSSDDRDLILKVANTARLQHSKAWLIKRAESFLSGATSRKAVQRWGWKEPNTHVVIDRIFASEPTARYIHFLRHPLDMALSNNQSQLEQWGPMFLNREVTIDPPTSLAYWCAAHSRVRAFLLRWPERALSVEFDELCATPDRYSRRIAEFLGVDLPHRTESDFRDFVGAGRPSRGRWKAAELTQMSADDLGYVRDLGYLD